MIDELTTADYCDHQSSIINHQCQSEKDHG
jgi:hypothetical protein